MSKRTIAAIIKDLKTKVNYRDEKPSKSKLCQTIKQSPNSIEAKLVTSPHAAILSSPLRYCSFSGRMFPSELLLRFSTAWHPQTKLYWAFPTIGASKQGFGYYVKLDRKILNELEKGAYKSLFRSNSIAFRKDMIEHTENMLKKQTFLEFTKHPIHIYNTFSMNALQQQRTSLTNYQCILILDSNINDVHIKLEGQQQVPYYYMQQFWSKEQIETIRAKLPPSTTMLGVPKCLETVRLAIDLWRCKQILIT